ncbi:MAG TPA: cupredoxin domain-containing protein [Gaiellaceae bacterium]|nr:cupredoxin domain-containing protein [Gaiellaceae bacterium]
MRRLFLVALALALTPACGGDEAADEEGAEPSVGGAVVDVALSDFAIEPSSLALDPGTYTFHVVNEGATEHALEVEGPTGEETEELGPGESADLTVDLEDGEYEVYCPVGDHRDRGMEGTIAVGGGGGTTTDETTTEDEESDYRY